MGCIKKQCGFNFEILVDKEGKKSAFANQPALLWSLYKKFAARLHTRLYVQSTLVISNSKGLTETLRAIRTSTYQS